MEPIRQALVSIGGRARRLHGVPLKVSKSFLPCGATTLLDLCLWSLAEAGIERVVLAYHREEQWTKAQEQVVRDHRGLDVAFFRDEGAGVHGIPFQALDLLGETFLFEAGHGVSSPWHHAALIDAKRPGNVVFSGFRPARGNPRFEVEVPWRGGSTVRWALAQPMVVDREWARSVRDHGFVVNRAAEAWWGENRLRVVPSGLPVEFDTYLEYRRAINLFERNMSGCRLGTPWLGEPKGDLSTRLNPYAQLLAVEPS